MTIRQRHEEQLVELVERGHDHVYELAETTGLAPGSVRIYFGTGWARLRPGRPRPTLHGGGQRREARQERDRRESQSESAREAAQQNTEEEADRRLHERLLRTPTDDDLRQALDRMNGGGEHELPVTRSRLRHAPTFGGLTISREDLVERMAVAFARVAGHLYFDALPKDKQAAYLGLAENSVVALELVEHDLRAAAEGKTRWL